MSSRAWDVLVNSDITRYRSRGQYLDGASYQRGALMMHRLRQTVGDDAFFSGLRLFFEEYGGETASRDEFRIVMEDASGMELEAFFAEWLE